jgi:hypothetical protein
MGGSVSQPVNALAIDGAKGTEVGEVQNSKGHTHFTMFVIAHGYVAGNDNLTVELQHSPRGDNWTAMASVDESDLSPGDSTSTSVEMAAEYVRPAITTFSDASGSDLSVDVFLIASGHSGSGRSGTGV